MFENNKKKHCLEIRRKWYSCSA